MQVENSSRSIPVTQSDPQVLHCNICMEPLAPRLPACSSCCIKYSNKCPNCSSSTGDIRCLAVEKFIESVISSCQNAQYGCKETFSYSKKNNHEQACLAFALLLTVTSLALPKTCHFTSPRNIHPWSRSFGTTTVAQFALIRMDLVLQEEKDGLLFLLNNGRENFGNSVVVSSIGTCSSKGKFMYSLNLSNGCTSIGLLSFTNCVRGLQESSSPTVFLPVPWGLFVCFAKLKLDVYIWRC